MAMKVGLGVSKILMVAGAGFTCSFLMNHGNLSKFVTDIQSIAKQSEKTGDDSDYGSDAFIADQVRQLAMEVRQLASVTQMTVLNGDSRNITSMLVSAASLGTLGYGYMWWKGISFSDLMYVTKRNMANAASNMTKNLENISDGLARTKEHLMQRILGLDEKINLQGEIIGKIHDETSEANSNISKIQLDLEGLHYTVNALYGRVDSLDNKLDFTNEGVLYLCDFVNQKKYLYNSVDGNEWKMLDGLKDQLKLSVKTRGLLTNSDTSPKLQGLKDIVDGLTADGFCNLDKPLRTLLRASTAFSVDSSIS